VEGEIDGLFQPVKSKVLDAAIPAQFSAKRAADGGVAWFGFSTRARVIVYDKVKVKREDVDTYEKLADPVNKGKLCIRSGSHPYNLSLFGAMVEHLGPAKTEAWLQGLVNNMARPPKGGDTDQIKGVASGECGIGVTNTYYLARMMRSSNPEERAVAEKVGVGVSEPGQLGNAHQHRRWRHGAPCQEPGQRGQVPEYLASPRRRTTSPMATMNGRPPRA
jgi:iron(III) transport system substrate-binding protein